MKKIPVLIFSLLLFWIAYQVRLEFIKTRDYNEPSDAAEYKHARPGANGVFVLVSDIAHGKGITQSDWLIRHNTDTLNLHGTPLYIAYLVLLQRQHLDPQMVAPMLHAGFVVFLFFLAWKFFSPAVALVVGTIATVYTPLFAFVSSWMPESISPVAVPVFVIISTLLVLTRKHWIWFLVAGIFLFLAGFTRHVFSFYGVLFITLWVLVSPKRTQGQVVALLVGYALPTIVWRLWLMRFGTSVYGEGAIQSTIVVGHRLATDGWYSDGIKGLTWWDMVYRVVLYQNPFALVLLELERISRLLKTAANSYSTSFPLPQEVLQMLHTFILFFAAWGLRRALKHKPLFLLASLIVWNTLFVVLYYVEEIRYQLPVVGVLLLLSGAGVFELVHLWRKRDARIPVVVISGLFFFWLAMRAYLIGLELWLVPFIWDSRVWRWMHIVVATGVFVFACNKLNGADHREKLVANHPWMRRAYVLLPVLTYLIVLASALRSRTWHEWRAPIRAGQRIEQKIVISNDALEKVRQKKGYLIIDFQDANAAQFLRIRINNEERTDYLPIGNRVSPVDLMATRQWQRVLPRLGGYTHIEEALLLAPTWPDLHEWLVIAMEGTDVKEENIITIENNNLLSSQPAIIFGDYQPYDRGFYEGPTPRLFQGNRTHNKYQVEGDMRLTETRALKSLVNKSTLVNGRGEHTDDLSTVSGLQKGRYRIFFLFPFTTGDPEDIF